MIYNVYFPYEDLLSMLKNSLDFSTKTFSPCKSQEINLCVFSP